MKRTLTGLLFVGLLVLMAAAPTDTATLDDCGDKKGLVSFSHEKHAGADCVACHHTSEGLTADSEMEVQKCTACHLNPADEATPSCAEMSLKKNPYHASCMGCHKTEGKGPTKCDDCHVKA